MEDLSELVNCGICFREFNRADRTPKIISTCGHTLCFSCLSDILSKRMSCPFGCSQVIPNRIEEFPPNLAMLQFVDTKNKMAYETCTKHKKSKNLVCMTHNCSICEDCQEEHKGCKKESVDEIKGQAQAKKARLKSLLEDFEVKQQDVEIKIKDKKKGVATYMEAKFNEMRELLKNKEKEAFCELDFLFDKSNELEEIFKKDDKIKEQIEEEISDLEHIQVNRRLLKTLESQTVSVGSQDEYNIWLGKVCDVMKSSFNSLIIDLGRSIMSLSEKLDWGFEETGVINMINVKKEENKEFESMANALEVKISNRNEEIEIVPKTNSKRHSGHPLDFNTLQQKNLIRIDFDKSKLKDAHFEALKYILSYIENALTVIVNFSNQDLGDKHLSLLSGMVLPVKLKELSFFCDHSEVSDIGIVDFMENISTRILNIEDLDFSVCYTKLTDTGISSLSSQIFHKFTKLTSICFGFTDLHLTDTGIQGFCKGLKPILGNLKCFMLGVAGTKISNSSIQTILEDILSHTSKLQKFELFLGKTKIDDEGIISLFGDKLTLLVNFGLDLERTSVSNKVMMELQKQLQNGFKNLQGFWLNVENTKVTHKDVKKLFNTIDSSFQKNLDGFKLEFEKK